jgi:hypothetical protein
MDGDNARSGTEDIVRERPAWLIPAMALAATALLSAGILLYYFAPAPDLLISRTLDQDRPERVFAATLGDNRFLLPERYVREIVEDRSGKIESIELHAEWPLQLADPPAVDLARRRLLDPATALYLTLTTADPGADSGRRLEELYGLYFDGPGTDAGNGLTRHGFKPGSGYADQELFVGGEGERRFIARCFPDSPQPIVATCLRDRLADTGLAVRYRFNRELLPEWQQLEAGVTALLDRLRAP